ncbi:Ada2a-containing complex component 1 [Carabus blaptoides fortunei]
MASSSKDTTDLEENDLFYFESDHLALKGNRDYSDVLKTIALLEAQRAQAVKDIDKLIELQKQAEHDPLSFMGKLKRKEDLGIPGPLRVAEIPKIDFHKYNVPIPEDAVKLLEQETILEATKQFKEPKKPKHNNSSTTFNKPWSSDEQKKLEELLIKFPPEAIEMRRYKKVAEALGNRTVKQVMSRVQKYFLKLHNAGLPIPGRIPKTADKKRKYNHRHQRHNAYLYKPTTFFPDMEVPVFMSENDDDLPGPSVAPPDQSTEQANMNKVKVEKKDDTRLKIDLLRKVKMVKEKEKNTEPFAHIGYKCDICNEDPIIGSRWHCFDCKQDSIDFCTDCLVSQLDSPVCHPLVHHLMPLQNDQTDQPSINLAPNLDSAGISSMHIKSEPNSENDTSTSDSDSAEGTSNDSDGNSKTESEQTCEYDKDYTSEIFSNKNGNYNYLDPNFLPE